jgi:hypothetical protein
MLKQHKSLDELAGEIAAAPGDLDSAGQWLAIALSARWQRTWRPLPVVVDLRLA